MKQCANSDGFVCFQMEKNCRLRAKLLVSRCGLHCVPTLCDPGRRLAEEFKRQFNFAEGERCEQGQIYIRPWAQNTNVKSSVDSNSMQTHSDE